MKTFPSILEDFNTKLWRHHLYVPEEIAGEFIDGDNRRVICKLNEQAEIRSALMRSKKGWFILVNKQIRDKLEINTGDEVSVSIEKDTSEYGMDVPDSLQVLMDQDDEGRKYFLALTMGKQRSLIYIVSKVKNVDSQINKSLAIMDHLKEVQGKLDFKALNQKIKEYNNRGKMI